MAAAAPSWMEEAGVAVLEEGGRRNPSLSDSYRPDGLPRPNATVLEAQARVCTGPEQTRPLGEEQAMKVLDTILRSAMGQLKDEPVSSAQLGAFFAGMTIRANSFPEATQWSEGERRAMTIFWPRLVQVLPPEVKFIADPEGTIMGSNGLTGPRYLGQGTGEMRLVGALREVLAGGHLGYEEVQCVLKDILPLGSNTKLTVVSEALLAAFLIGQRMNRETDRELKAYCLAFDDELGPPPVADVKSLTHYGEPYDGNTRFFRSTLFVAAVRACYGEACLLHGVEWMPPKGGIAEGQMLKFMGANTHLSPTQAKTLLEDENTGFAYLNLQEACPPLHSIIGLREHIKKRPPLATSEKVQQFVRARGRESMVAGFYHEGYEDPLLMLMRRRTVHAGLVVKGEEGALSMTTKERSAHASKGLPVNHCSGFRTPSSTNYSETDGVSRESFRVVVNAQELGFESTETPRTDRSVLKNLELGLAALGGEKGAAYDRIVLNAAMVDHLLGCSGAEDVHTALDRAREAVDSGPEHYAARLDVSPDAASTSSTSSESDQACPLHTPSYTPTPCPRRPRSASSPARRASPPSPTGPVAQRCTTGCSRTRAALLQQAGARGRRRRSWWSSRWMEGGLPRCHHQSTAAGGGGLDDEILIPLIHDEQERRIRGRRVCVPMATTEGCLVGSTNPPADWRSGSIARRRDTARSSASTWDRSCWRSRSEWVVLWAAVGLQ